jgi:hypothetical protein
MKVVPPKPAKAKLAEDVRRVVFATPVIDLHSHLFEPGLGNLLLWGIDELLIYHYLVAEGFRYLTIPYETFWKLSKSEQADLIWKELFSQRSPMSEAARGILTVLHSFGLEAGKNELPKIRRWFGEQKVKDQVTRSLHLAGIQSVGMTNSLFEAEEVEAWKKSFPRDPRFFAALRIDPLLLAWPVARKSMQEQGFKPGSTLNSTTVSECRRFLELWTERMKPRFAMVSLPPDFYFPARNTCSEMLEKVVMPHCRDFNLPFALMPGVKRSVNPGLRLAGDGVGLTDLSSVGNLCAAYPQNKFLITVLARENQHELCVLARKFRNLHIFGCWWFTNIPMLVEEITRMRLDLLGLSFTAQHSDARILEQVIYKWNHTKEILTKVLTERYQQLADSGWKVEVSQMEKDVQLLLGGAFEEFCARS